MPVRRLLRGPDDRHGTLEACCHAPPSQLAMTDQVDLLSNAPLTGGQRTFLEQKCATFQSAVNAARANGNNHAALQAYFQLIPYLSRLYTDKSIEYADAFAGLGECLLESTRLEKFEGAAEGFTAALKVREYTRFGGLAKGERGLPIAVTRENMALAKEGMKQLLEAREFRMRGKDENEMICSNFRQARFLELISCSALLTLHSAQAYEFGR
jgi:hypothetical protein